MIAPVPAQRVVTLWLPVAAWAALIFVLSSIPSLSTGLGTWDLLLRKAAHVTEYAILSALLMRALDRPAVAVTLAIAYAATDELHQHFVPGRAGTLVDVVVDAVGVTLGVVLYRGPRS
jgi:VanZ family protein